MRKNRRSSPYFSFLIALACVPSAWAGADAPPPPPRFSEPGNPSWRTVETVYRCPDGEGRFSVRYTLPVPVGDTSRGITFIAGRRRGATLPRAELDRASQGLRQLDAVIALQPLCNDQGDTIMAIGLLGRRQAIVYLGWLDNRIEAHSPTLVGQPEE